MESAKEPVNWSALACEAFENKLDELESGKPGAVVRDVLRARRLEIVDDAGQARVLLAVHGKDGPHVALTDEKGTVRAKLLLSAAGPALFLLDSQGGKRLACGLLDDGAKFEVYDDDQSRRAVLGCMGETQHSKVGLLLFDRDGARRATVGVTAANTELSVCNDQGDPIWQAPTNGEA